MFEEGNLLMFRPFLFKNEVMPKNKFFLILANVGDELLLASLPTSKDYVPSDINVSLGCLELSERFVNVFVFVSGEEIAIRESGERFSFSKNTFVYGANLDIYDASQFKQQERLAQTDIEVIGRLNSDVFAELKDCLAKSKMVKNKYRKILG